MSESGVWAGGSSGPFDFILGDDGELQLSGPWGHFQIAFWTDESTEKIIPAILQSLETGRNLENPTIGQFNGMQVDLIWDDEYPGGPEGRLFLNFHGEKHHLSYTVANENLTHLKECFRQMMVDVQETVDQVDKLSKELHDYWETIPGHGEAPSLLMQNEETGELRWVKTEGVLHPDDPNLASKWPKGWTIPGGWKPPENS